MDELRNSTGRRLATTRRSAIRPAAVRWARSQWLRWARVLVPVLAFALVPAATACAGPDGTRWWQTAAGGVAETWTPAQEDTVLGVSRDALQSAIEARVTGGERTEGLSADEWSHVRALYESYAHAPLWLTGDGLQRRASDFIGVVAEAHREALRPSDYPLAALRDALGLIRDARGGGAALSPDQVAHVDVLLTSTYVSFAEDLLTGRIHPRAVAQSWHIDVREPDVDSVLARTLRSEPLGEALARLRPPDEAYEALRRELARYRTIVERGGWPEVPRGVALRPGDTATVERLGALVERLRAEEYDAALGEVLAPPDSQPPDTVATGAAAGPPRAIYDAPLAAAVAAFQARHGLEVDSILGPRTLGALNAPAEFRLRQIAANLERHRWLPRELGDRYILVNIPAFRLDAFDGGEPALSMRVIAGATYEGRATPTFADSMSYVVFRPYWNVPESIADRDLWPHQNSDPGYFARHGYEVVNADWGTYVRQRPGPDNALGDVKFMFPNDFNIYLHDTPAGELFERAARAFSAGCIRVEHPDELGRFVLGPQGWDADSVRKAMAGAPDDFHVDLERKVPVYIVYFTTYFRDGQLHFAGDVYDRDQPLVPAMAGAAMPDPEEVARASALLDLVREITGD